MKLRAVIIGTVGGLLIGGIIGILQSSHHRRGDQAVPLGEDGGRISRVVMQYHPAAGPLVTPIYSQFLSAVGKDVEVIWVVGKSRDADDLKHRLGQAWPAGRCRTVVVGKEISTWAKDRFVALFARGRGAVLCAPARTRTANPLRTHDQEVPYRLAQDTRLLFRARETMADYDGGDFLATARHLFVSPAVLDKNKRELPGFQSTSALTDHLEQMMGRTITWLGDASQESPPHHVGMFLTVIGNTAAVGDVRLAERLAASHPETRTALQAAGGEAPPEFRANLSALLDRIARQMHSLNYTVVRVPLLPSATPKAWMSYNNGIVETRHGRPIFYMPTFGAKGLDTAAAETFRAEVGCRVVPIDCAKIWPLGGSLHCLVNVVARRSD